MERQRKLLMEGKLVKCPKELSNHPVFMVNQMTNKIVLNKRAKVRAQYVVGEKTALNHFYWATAQNET